MYWCGVCVGVGVCVGGVRARVDLECFVGVERSRVRNVCRMFQIFK